MGHRRVWYCVAKGGLAHGPHADHAYGLDVVLRHTRRRQRPTHRHTHTHTGQPQPHTMDTTATTPHGLATTQHTHPPTHHGFPRYTDAAVRRSMCCVRCVRQRHMQLQQLRHCYVTTFLPERPRVRNHRAILNISMLGVGAISGLLIASRRIVYTSR